MIEDAEPIVKWAMEIADKLPEKYQEAAFAELLRYALKSRAVDSEDGAETSSETEARSQLREAWQTRLIDGLPGDHLVVEKGSRGQQTLWVVIKLWAEGTEVTSESIREAIKTRLGMTPQLPTNTTKTLRKLTPRYVNRQKRKDGQGYTYTPTAMALEVFEGLGE